MAKNVGICYALVSRDDVILCDHSLSGSNFESMCQAVLENVMMTRQNDKFSFDSGRYTCHAYRSGNIIYVCVTEAMFDRNIAFNCLFELERQLISAGLKDRAQTARPFALRSPFSATMATTLSRYSSSDALGRLESKVDDVTGIMRQNIDKVIHRGQTLDDLNERSDLLAHSSTGFRQNATKLRRKLCWKNVKMWVILIISLVILLTVIIVIIISVLAAQGKLKK